MVPIAIHDSRKCNAFHIPCNVHVCLCACACVYGASCCRRLLLFSFLLTLTKRSFSISPFSFVRILTKADDVLDDTMRSYVHTFDGMQPNERNRNIFHFNYSHSKQLTTVTFYSMYKTPKSTKFEWVRTINTESLFATPKNIESMRQLNDSSAMPLPCVRVTCVQIKCNTHISCSVNSSENLEFWRRQSLRGRERNMPFF